MDAHNPRHLILLSMYKAKERNPNPQNEKGKEMQKERERCYQPQLAIRQQLGLMNIRIARCAVRL